MLNAVGSSSVAFVPQNRGGGTLENLAVIADSHDPRSASYGKYSDKEVGEAWDKLAAREEEAFLRFYGDASNAGIKRFAEAYIRYMDQLSPEERDSPRYRGTREEMSSLLAEANARIAAEGGRPSGKEAPKNPLAQMLAEMVEVMSKQGNKKKDDEEDAAAVDAKALARYRATLTTVNAVSEPAPAVAATA